MTEANRAKRSKLDDDSRNHSLRPQSQQNRSSTDNEDGRRRHKRETSEGVNHNILKLTILNPGLPITIETIHAISSPHGQVLRIVMLKEHGIQALVEFDSIETAKRAKQSLHGAEIYSGCCTVKIDIAPSSKLKVVKNDTESWDYTNPNLGKWKRRTHRCLLDELRYGAPPIPDRGNGIENIDPMLGKVIFANVPYNCNENRYSHGMNGPSAAKVEQPSCHEPPASYSSSSDTSDISYIKGVVPKEEYPYKNEPKRSPPVKIGKLVPSSASVSGPAAPIQHGAVLMVYDLCMEKINADRLFNIFCQYGNVVKIKFFCSKERCAMVEMGDVISAERAVSNFGNTFMFGSKVVLRCSKQAKITDFRTFPRLPDGSPAFKDFKKNKNNRFLTPEMSDKNKIHPPTNMLYFFNTPPHMDEEKMNNIFTNTDAPRPKDIIVFWRRIGGRKSGIIEFETVTQAVEALSIMNHYPIKISDGTCALLMRLRFYVRIEDK